MANRYQFPEFTSERSVEANLREIVRIIASRLGLNHPEWWLSPHELVEKLRHAYPTVHAALVAHGEAHAAWAKACRDGQQPSEAVEKDRRTRENLAAAVRDAEK